MPPHRRPPGPRAGTSGSRRTAAETALPRCTGVHRPPRSADLTDTSPTDVVGPHPQWADPSAIVSLDPWGALVADAFSEQIAAGIDIRPTIAVTKAQVILPEVHDAILKGRLTPDGRVLLATGAAQVTKAAIE